MPYNGGGEMAKAENDKEDSDQKEFPKTVKVEHHRASNFISTFATNVVLTGPSADGFYHLIFYADAVAINHETAQLVETSKTGTFETEARYKTRLDKDSFRPFREDKARITLPISTLAEIGDLLIRRVPIEPAKVGPAKEAGTDGKD